MLPLIDLGEMYLNNFVKQIDPKLPTAPLALGMGKTGLVQLCDNPPLDALYRKYWYRSGTNQTMKSQLANLAGAAQEWLPVGDGDVVLDIGCNDGTLLSMMPESCIKVGIDPSRNLAAEGAEVCDFHGTDYFTAGLYKAIVPEGKRAAMVFTVAMFYDLPDPRAFLRDLYEVMDDEGLWVCQMSYAPLMIEQNAFDNICHEHLQYYSLRVFHDLAESEGFEIVDCDMNNTNGGSFRCFVRKKGATPLKNLFDREISRVRVLSTLIYEDEYGMNTAAPYKAMGIRVQKLRDETITLLRSLKKQGKKVLGYGASTKGQTLAQYYGLDPSLLQAVADKQPGKVGLRMVGSWLPIISEDEMRQANPDYLFVFPWHFKNEFLSRESDFRKKGGRIIFPLPDLEVI